MAKREKFKPDQVVAALKANSGLVYITADALGVSAQTVYNYANKYPAVKEAIGHEKGKRLDSAESALWKAVLDGEAWAVCFYLKTQGKIRGYVERQEVRSVTDDDIDHAIESELARVAGGRQGTVSRTFEANGEGPRT